MSGPLEVESGWGRLFDDEGGQAVIVSVWETGRGLLCVSVQSTLRV